MIKINKSKSLMALLLIITIVSSFLIGISLSKFLTSVENLNTTRVAIWDINKDEVIMNLFDTQYKNLETNEIIAKSNNLDEIISPGTSGESLFSIINHKGDIAPEVMYKVEINLDDSQVSKAIILNENIQWKLDDGDWGTWDQLKTALYSLSGDDSGIKIYKPGEFANAFKKGITHKIAWQWLIEDVDTNSMTDEEEYKAVISVKITAEQTDIFYEDVLDGSNQVIDINNVQSLTLRSKSDITNFERVEINGETLDESNYDISEGSTIITLKPEYITDLTTGRYIVNIVSNDMTSSTVFEMVDRLNISNVLSENSWDIISKVTKSGNATDYWSVGDKTSVKVNGVDKGVAIAGINHDGENTVTFTFTEALLKQKMGSNLWENSIVRNTTLPTILEQMENKNYIVEVEKQTLKGYANGNADNTIYEILTTTDKLFLPSITESMNLYGYKNEGTIYDYFRNVNNRIIKVNDKGVNYLTRTPTTAFSGFFLVDPNGDGNGFASWAQYHVVPMFVIG